MTIFIDASALIAIVAGEADGPALSDVLDADPLRLCSALSIWETVAGLRKSHGYSIAAARVYANRFVEAGKFRFTGIGERELEVAADAYARFGKGRHPAALNMGDCFAYACAKANSARLLFKGNDFSRTDIEVA